MDGRNEYKHEIQYRIDEVRPWNRDALVIVLVKYEWDEWITDKPWPEAVTTPGMTTHMVGQDRYKIIANARSYIMTTQGVWEEFDGFAELPIDRLPTITGIQLNSKSNTHIKEMVRGVLRDWREIMVEDMRLAVDMHQKNLEVSFRELSD